MSFITATVLKYVSGGLLFVCLLLGLALHMERRHSAKLQRQLTSEHAVRMAERESYKQAQIAAAAKNSATVERVKAEQEKITDEVKSDLSRRLERIRRELRDNPAAKGSAGSTPIPETGPAPCRAFNQAWLCLSPSDRLRAAENEERQDRLIDWNLRQSEIDPNAEAAH